MSAINDLSWSEVRTALLKLGKMDVVVDSYGKPTFNTSNNYMGVVEFCTRLLEGCRLAQETVNEGRPANEKLVSFLPSATSPPSNGFLPITRSVSSKYELGSVTKISGVNP